MREREIEMRDQKKKEGEVARFGRRNKEKETNTHTNTHTHTHTKKDWELKLFFVYNYVPFLFFKLINFFLRSNVMWMLTRNFLLLFY